MSSSSEIHIESTGTDPAVRARSALHQIHRRLQGSLATLIEVEPVADAGEAVRTALTEFCAGDLRRYPSACDRTLYATASGAAETRLLVRSLGTTAGVLDQHIDQLSAADDAASATSIARSVDAILRAHFLVERTVLLPALVNLPGADLPALLSDLNTLLGGGHLASPAVIDVRDIPHGRHDPKPLRREFEATHPGGFTWEYAESGPERWQVRIGRVTDGV